MTPAAAPAKKSKAPAPKKAESSAGAQIGVVESDKCAKTRTVVVRFVAKHPKYGKYVAKRTRLHVHDESNESHVGDRVEVIPCRPLSKNKNWKLLRVVERSPQS